MAQTRSPREHARSLTRRIFLKTMSMAGGGAVMAPILARTGWAQEFQLKAPEPNPRSGGTLRYGVLSAPAHFDVHQSGNSSATSPVS